MDREAWRAAAQGITKSRTQLSDLTELEILVRGLKVPKVLKFVTLFQCLGSLQ